jgi:hypothetical protein
VSLFCAPAPLHPCTPAPLHPCTPCISTCISACISACTPAPLHHLYPCVCPRPSSCTSSCAARHLPRLMEGLAMVPLPRTQLDAVVLSVILSAGLTVVEYLHHVVLTPYLCVLRSG